MIEKLLPNKSILSTFFYPIRNFTEKIEIESLKLMKNFERRKNFVFLGNMAHEPNLDGVNYLIKNIWPKIKVRY